MYVETFIALDVVLNKHYWPMYTYIHTHTHTHNTLNENINCNTEIENVWEIDTE